jgi:lambda family phage portal protein
MSASPQSAAVPVLGRPGLDMARIGQPGSVVLSRWLQQRPGGVKRAGLSAHTPLRLVPGGARRNYAAAQINRLTEGWTTSNLSANAEIQGGIDNLRARSRQLARDNDYVKKFLSLVATNVVGPTGIGHQARIYDANGTPDAAANKAVERAWQAWCALGVCDVAGRLSLRDLEHVLIKAAARDGEYLVRIIRGNASGNAYGLALQVLDIDRLDTRLNRPGANGQTAIRMGVELNAYGRPIAYHLANRHPGEIYAAAGEQGATHIVIPAADIIHGFISDRPEQVRGVPWAHASMLRLNNLAGYEEAAVVAARVGASKMGFFTKDQGTPEVLEGVADEEDASGQLLTDADPGTFGELPGGVSFQAFNPDYPHAMFAEFVKSHLRGISSGLGVAYHSLANDLEGVSFSSIRSGTLEERDEWMVLQRWFIESFHERLYAEWLRHALGFGLVVFDSGKAAPASVFDKFSAHAFRGRRWQWVDPLRDVQANVEAINNKLKAPQDVANEMGEDYEDVLVSIKAAQDMVAKLGIAPPASKPAAPAAGADPQQPAT